MLCRKHHERRFPQQPVDSTQVNSMKIAIYCLFSLILNGVFGVEVKSAVMEGHSVTLHTDVIKQRDDLIVWFYGPKKTFVATIKGKVGTTKLSDDEIFKDRLKLNDKTGSLTINNLTTNHSGLYTLKISSNNTVSYKRFNVTVSEDISSSESSDSPAMWIIILVTAVVILIFIIIIIIIIIISFYRCKRGGDKATSPTKERLMDGERNI